jgi:hypothetical protein
MPTIMLSYFGLPTIEGNDDLGASSPERPALHIPDPLSMTTGTPFYSAIISINL